MKNYCHRCFFCGGFESEMFVLSKNLLFCTNIRLRTMSTKKSNGRSIICFVLFFFHYQAVIIFICRFIIIRIINNMTATAAAVFLFCWGLHKILCFATNFYFFPSTTFISSSVSSYNSFFTTKTHRNIVFSM